MARDFEGTLAQLAVIGYQQVEFAGYLDRRLAKVKSILERHGLAAPSAHVPIDVLRRDWARTLDAAHFSCGSPKGAETRSRISGATPGVADPLAFAEASHRHLEDGIFSEF